MDASHQGWFASLFQEFRRAIDTHDFVGKDAREALLCLELIHRGYASARSDCRMLDVRGDDDLSALSGAPGTLVPRKGFEHLA
jgi:hypothetical protein